MYMARAVSEERAHDEYLHRRMSEWLVSQGRAVDKQRSSLSHFYERELLCRIEDGHLVRGPAWGRASLDENSFARFLAERDKAREAAKYRL